MVHQTRIPFQSRSSLIVRKGLLDRICRASIQVQISFCILVRMTNVSEKRAGRMLGNASFRNICLDRWKRPCDRVGL